MVCHVSLIRQSLDTTVNLKFAPFPRVRIKCAEERLKTLDSLSLLHVQIISGAVHTSLSKECQFFFLYSESEQ